MIFGVSCIEMTEQNLDFNLSSKVIVSQNCPPKIGSEALSRPNFYQFKWNLVCFISTMIWGYMPKLGAVPPTGHEIPKMAIFPNNFWTVSQKIMILMSVDTLYHVESGDTNVRIWWTACLPFWNSSTLNSMSRRYLRTMNTAPPSVPEI